MKAYIVGALVVLTAVGGLLVNRVVLADSDSDAGSVTFEIVDPGSRGVPGVVIIATTGATARTATTGTEQPTDADLAAAARQGAKAVTVLNAAFAARARLAGLPMGTVSISIASNAKPVVVTLTRDQPTWKIRATLDPKSKRLIGAPKVLFDEVADAKAQAAQAQTAAARAQGAQAQAEAARAQAEAARNREAQERARAEQDRARDAEDRARAEQDRARADQERYRADQERAQADKARSDREIARAEAERTNARAAEGEERTRRQRAEAPSRVVVTAGRCDCVAGNQIQVWCEVQNNSEVSVAVSLSVFAQGGTFSVGADGQGTTSFIPPGRGTQLPFNAALRTPLNCKSCKNQTCTITDVSVR